LKKIAGMTAGLALALNLTAQVEPQAGQWKNWVISSGSAYRLPARLRRWIAAALNRRSSRASEC